MGLYKGLRGQRTKGLLNRLNNDYKANSGLWNYRTVRLLDDRITLLQDYLRIAGLQVYRITVIQY